MNESHGISFVLCCYNSEKVINESIQALQRQNNLSVPYEVILVDNNCTDNTINIAKNTWKRTDIDLRIVSEPKPGLTNARMRGVACANYDYISFVDDDNFIEVDWVTKVCRIFEENKNVGAVGSHNIPIVEGNIPTWFPKVMMNYACGQQLSETGYARGERKHLWGAGLSIRKAVIKEIFSPQNQLFLTDRVGKTVSSAGDSEICFICQLMGWDLWYEDNLFLSHKIVASRLNWKYFCKLHEGFGSANLITKLYKRKIDNLPPVSLGRIFCETTISLLSGLWQNKGIPREPVDGNILHRDIYFHWGRLKSAIRLRKQYGFIVQSIYEKVY